MSYIQLSKICLIACLVSMAASTISINSMVPDQAFKLTGFTNVISFGIPTPIASAGDVNGDGYADFIVGSMRDTTSAGAVYVIYGDSTGTLQTRFGTNFVAGVNIDPSAGFRIAGPLGFGSWVDSAGDIDNDGYADILIGSPSEVSSTGAVYVLYGAQTSTLASRFNAATPFTVGTSMPSAYGFRISGRVSGGIFGSFLSTAGDINNDNYADIIIGAPYEDSRRGAAYVFYGASKSVLQTRFGANFPVGTSMPLTTGFRLQGSASSVEFGISISSAGDINGDDYADLFIGARAESSNRGAAYVLYGDSQSVLATRLGANFLTSASMSLNVGFRLLGNGVGGFAGILASLGDINDDGYDDIIVGASQETSNQGAAYVLYGGDSSTLATRYTQSFTVSSSMSSTTGFRVTGPTTTTLFGNAVSSAGDLNGDGYADIMIGSANEVSGTGAVYILYGADQTTLASRFGPSYAVSATMLPSVGAKITGPSTGSSFGYAPVSLAGDINGDGIKDLLIGAKVDSTGKSAVYVVYNYNCPAILSNGNCVDICPIKFFSDNGLCTACTTGCNLCTSSASDDCLACATGNLHEGSCVTTCPAGFFARNKVCVANPTGCSSYSVQDSECTACTAGFALHNGACVEECPCGFFNKNGVCSACTAGCCSCTSRDSNACTKCSGNFLLEGSCVYPCPEGYFNDQGVCTPCFAGCRSCSSEASDACSSCISDVLFNGSCVTSCPDHYTNVNGVCTASS